MKGGRGWWAVVIGFGAGAARFWWVVLQTDPDGPRNLTVPVGTWVALTCGGAVVGAFVAFRAVAKERDDVISDHYRKLDSTKELFGRLSYEASTLRNGSILRHIGLENMSRSEMCSQWTETMKTQVHNRLSETWCHKCKHFVQGLDALDVTADGDFHLFWSEWESFLKGIVKKMQVSDLANHYKFQG